MIKGHRLAKLYFLDFEASSLNDGSFPIEIAWVDASGQGESYLIKPQPYWTDWSMASQGIHHISRSQLDEKGTPARKVAKRASEVLQTAIICSDNPAFDEHWLSLLLSVNGIVAPPVMHLLSVMGVETRRLLSLIKDPEDTPAWHREARKLLDEGDAFAARQSENEATRKRVRHRALPDAEAMWWCWRQLKDWVDQRLTDHQSRS
jgi:hypothetical protein